MRRCPKMVGKKRCRKPVDHAAKKCHVGYGYCWCERLSKTGVECEFDLGHQGPCSWV